MAIQASSSFLVLLKALLCSFVDCSLTTDDLLDLIENRGPVFENSERYILFRAI